MFSKGKVSHSKAQLLKAKCNARARQLLDRCCIEICYENTGFWAPGWYGTVYCPDYLLKDVAMYLPYIDDVAQGIDIISFGYESALERIHTLEKRGVLLSDPIRYLELTYVLT